MDAESIKQRLSRFAFSERPDLFRIAEIAFRRSEAIWLVGGVVRDAALGRGLSDVDIAVDGDSEVLASEVATALGGAYVPLHDNPATARVVKGGFEFDFVALRAPTVHEDLQSRDLRINAMAALLTPNGLGDILDPTGAMLDIDSRVIRAISSKNLQSDPLRALRVFRFMAQIGFSVDPQTLDWASDAAAGLHTVAGERVFAELAKLLSTPRAAGALSLANEYQVLPGIMASEADSSVETTGRSLHGISFSSVEVFDMWPDLCRNLYDDFDDLAATIANDRLCSDPTIMKAAALFGAMGGGLEALKASCQRWKAPKRFYGAVAKILELQDLLATSVKKFLNSPERMRVFAHYTHETGDAWLAAASYALVQTGDSANDFTAFFHDLIRAYQEIISIVDGSPPLVDGSRLIGEFKIEPGPVVGELLTQIREERIAGTVRSIDEALEWCRCQLAEMSHAPR